MLLREFRRAVVLLGLVCGTIEFAPRAESEEIKVADSVVDVQYDSKPSADLQALADRWVRDSGHAVANYYGKFPVPRVTLHLTPHDGNEPTGGNTTGWNGANISIGLGRKVTHAGLVADWILPHEMIHLALPDLRERHHWLEEGLATYIEPVARARVGLITPAEAWSGMEEGLPQGLPKAGDRGLDHTRTWGRTYWGGALFCLRADVEIRKRTGNQRGLEHAVRAILAAGGSIQTAWEIDRVISVADAGSGVPAFRELYDEMKAAPDPVDLPALWKELGVVRRGETVVFIDNAPLAAIRKAITGG